MQACGSRVSLAPAPLRRGARRCPAGRQPAPVARAALSPRSAAEEAWPWLASAGPVSVRAEAPPVMPRFMEAGGPTDPMALLMRQRIVFLGTQARALRHARAWAGLHRVAGVGAALRGAAAARRRVLGTTLSPAAWRAALTLLAPPAAAQVDDFTADAVVSQLLYLDAQEPGKARPPPLPFAPRPSIRPRHAPLFRAPLTLARFARAGHQALHQQPRRQRDRGHGRV